MRNFRQLTTWQRSHQLTLNIYTLSKTFLKEEVFGLTSQMRRSSSSVPTNIAEGCGRESVIELKRFLMIAIGSVSELQYQLILSRDLQYINETIYKELYEETIQIRKMIFTYAQKLTADR